MGLNWTTEIYISMVIKAQNLHRYNYVKVERNIYEFLFAHFIPTRNYLKISDHLQNI